MRITLRQLEVLQAVADAGSTTAAGARIALSQSATSAALVELESLLGAALFDRVGKRLVLNERGRGLLPQARGVLDAVQAIERSFGVGPGGAGAAAAPALDLRLGASTTIGNYLLPSMLAGLLQRQPAARVQLRVGNTQAIAEAAARLEIDVGLVEGACPSPALRARRWREDTLVLVCAADDPLARRRAPLDRAALRGARWLLRERGSGTREAVEQALLRQVDDLGDALEFGSTEALKQAAAAGLGLTCLSSLAVQDLVALGRLVVLRSTLPAIVRPLYLVHHRAKQLPAALWDWLFDAAAG